MMFNHRLLIQTSLHLSSSQATLANCKASKGILSLKIVFGPSRAIFY